MAKERDDGARIDEDNQDRIADATGASRDTGRAAMMERPMSILIADDDPDDRMMIQEAFTENRIANKISFVEDGEQLMAYLHRKGTFAKLKDRPYPGIILLDLNMPKKEWP